MRRRLRYGDDQDRQVCVLRNVRSDLRHYVETVHVRHMHVQHQQVGIDLGEDVLHLSRVVGADHGLESVVVQQIAENGQIVRLVIHAQDLRV